MSFNRLGRFLGRTACPAFQSWSNTSFSSSRTFLSSLDFTKNTSTQQLQKRLFCLSIIRNGLPDGKIENNNAMRTLSCSKRLQDSLRSFRAPIQIMPCDVTICVEGTEQAKAEIFEAHKFVLGIFSERFREMWRADVHHKFDGPENFIRFTNVEPHAFDVMLRYMYADDTNDITMENAMDLLFCASFFKVNKLTQICQDFIEISLKAANPCHVLQRAGLMGEERLAILALSTICKAPDGAFASREFLQLFPSDLKMILDRDDLNMPEHVIYQHVHRWAVNRMCQPDSKWKNLRDTIGDLRSAICFPLFDRDLLDSGPLKDGVITLQELEVSASSVSDSKLPVKSSPRIAAPAPFYISCQIGCDAFGDDQPDFLTSRVVIELRPEFAPQTCAYTRKLVELAQSWDTLVNVRLVPCDGFFIDREHADTILQPPESLAHETSILSRTVAGAVCFGWEGNHCIIEKARFRQGIGDLEYSIWLASQKPDGGAVFGRIVRGLELLQAAYSHFLAGDVAAGSFGYWTTNWCLHNSFPAKLKGKYGGMEVDDDLEDEPAPDTTSPTPVTRPWKRSTRTRKIIRID